MKEIIVREREKNPYRAIRYFPELNKFAVVSEHGYNDGSNAGRLLNGPFTSLADAIRARDKGENHQFAKESPALNA